MVRRKRKSVESDRVKVRRISMGLFEDIEVERKRMEKQLGRQVFFSDASESLRRKLKRRSLDF